MITLQDVLRFHELSIERFGGLLGIRDYGYLQSAIERPFSTFGGDDLYPSPYQKAAAILESIYPSYPFIREMSQVKKVCKGERSICEAPGNNMLISEADSFLN